MIKIFFQNTDTGTMTMLFKTKMEMLGVSCLSTR